MYNGFLGFKIFNFNKPLTTLGIGFVFSGFVEKLKRKNQKFMKRVFLIVALAGITYANGQEKPLEPEQIEKENAATAVEEQKVAAEKSEAEIALEQGKEIVVRDTTLVYTATSQVENSGFQRTVGFDGAWKFDLDLDNREIVLTGGTLSNKGEAASNNLRLMVYLAEKPFDLNNPEFVGKVYSAIDVNPIGAGEVKSGQAYVTSWASETNPPAGTYYPYILLGEENPENQEFEVRDVKAFSNSITIQ